MIDLMVTVGRLGRSLGLHLLLASQRLDEGRLRGLESHLSYRIALRTFSASESRAVLGVPDAHQLPPDAGFGLPGHGHRRAGPVPGRVRVRPAGGAGPRRGAHPGRAGAGAAVPGDGRRAARRPRHRPVPSDVEPAAPHRRCWTS